MVPTSPFSSPESVSFNDASPSSPDRAFTYVGNVTYPQHKVINTPNTSTQPDKMPPNSPPLPNTSTPQHNQIKYRRLAHPFQIPQYLNTNQHRIVSYIAAQKQIVKEYCFSGTHCFAKNLLYQGGDDAAHAQYNIRLYKNTKVKGAPIRKGVVYRHHFGCWRRLVGRGRRVGLLSLKFTLSTNMFALVEMGRFPLRAFRLVSVLFSET